MSNQTISPEDEINILALSRIEGLGLGTFRTLLQHFGSVDVLDSASYKELSHVVRAPIAKAIMSLRNKAFEKYLKKIERLDVQFITLCSENYPPLLKEIPDPPLVLYIKGVYDTVQYGRCFAVVGTRNATQYGLAITRKFVRELSQVGLSIVSGMAFGIDKAAHKSALENDGKTVAVLSGGVHVASPQSNQAVYDDILSNNGCILSEDHLDSDVFPGMFAKRNRIVSGLSIGTLVVEAGAKSGALITTHCALEQGREVFAIPSNLSSHSGIGTNALIKKGEAKLVQTVDDILEEFGMQKSREKVTHAEKLDPVEKKIIATLNRGPMTVDTLFQSLSISIDNLTRLLSIMELEGKLVKIEGNKYAVAY